MTEVSGTATSNELRSNEEIVKYGPKPPKSAKDCKNCSQDPSKRFCNCGRPRKFKNVDDLIELIEKYQESCWTIKLDAYGNRVKEKEKVLKRDNEGNLILTDSGKPTYDIIEYGYVKLQSKPYTWSSLAAFLGTDTETLNLYEDGFYDSSKDTFSVPLYNIHNIIKGYAEDKLFTSKNPNGVIFNMGVNYNRLKKSETFDTNKKIAQKEKELSEKLQKLQQSEDGRTYIDPEDTNYLEVIDDINRQDKDPEYVNPYVRKKPLNDNDSEGKSVS